MYKIYKNGDTTTAHVQEYVADTPADIAELPTDMEPGSTCLVISNSAVYMLGNDKQWHEI